MKSNVKLPIHSLDKWLTIPVWLPKQKKTLLIIRAVSPAGDSFRHIPQGFSIVMDLLSQSCQPVCVCVCFIARAHEQVICLVALQTEENITTPIH